MILMTLIVICDQQQNSKNPFYLYNRNYSVKTHQLIEEDDDFDEENYEELSSLIILPFVRKNSKESFQQYSSVDNYSRKKSLNETQLSAKDVLRKSIVIHKSDKQYYSSDIICSKDHKDSICSVSYPAKNYHNKSRQIFPKVNVIDISNNNISSDDLVSNYTESCSESLTNPNDRQAEIANNRNKFIKSLNTNSKVIYEFGTNSENGQISQEKNEDKFYSDRAVSNQSPYQLNPNENMKKRKCSDISVFKKSNKSQKHDDNPKMNLEKPTNKETYNSNIKQYSVAIKHTGSEKGDQSENIILNTCNNSEIENAFQNQASSLPSITNNHYNHIINIKKNNRKIKYNHNHDNENNNAKNDRHNSEKESEISSSIDIFENDINHYDNISTGYYLNPKSCANNSKNSSKKEINSLLLSAPDPKNSKFKFRPYEINTNEDSDKGYLSNSLFKRCSVDDIPKYDPRAYENSKINYKPNSYNKLEFDSAFVLNAKNFREKTHDRSYSKMNANNIRLDFPHGKNITKNEKGIKEEHNKVHFMLENDKEQNKKIKAKDTRVSNMDKFDDINDTQNEGNQANKGFRKISFLSGFRIPANLVKDLKLIIKQENLKEEILKFANVKLSKHILERINMPPFRNVQIESKITEETDKEDLSGKDIYEPLRINHMQILSFLIVLILFFIIAILLIFLIDY